VAEPGLRARKKQQVRARILAVCGRLFRARGFDETTIDEIAAEVEISRQTFFNYFGSKEAVLATLGFQWLQEQAVFPERGLAALETMSPLEVVRHGVRMQMEAIEQDRDFMRLVFTRSGLLFPQGPHVGTESDRSRVDLTHALFAGVAALMRAGQQSGTIRDDLPPEQAAEIYVSVVLITARFWLTDYWGEGESLVERSMRTLDVLEAGLRAAGAPRAHTSSLASTQATREPADTED
jgi:AcrR family transcriptional regulator